MEPARTIPLIAGLVIISVIVAALLMRSIWREISGLSDENDDAQAGRTEEKKNAKIAKELEQRRNGK